MSSVKGFPAIYHLDTRILILGSMPGRASLEKAQYYAHPRNIFWRVLSDYSQSPLPSTYAEKRALLLRSHCGLWDVLAHCQRPGSLDANIVVGSEVVNDIARLATTLAGLKRIVLNGKKASQLFDSYIAQHQPSALLEIERVSVPSTSPANASMSYAEKYARWSAALAL